jgi:hypothetical protein
MHDICVTTWACIALMWRARRSENGMGVHAFKTITVR